MRIGIDARLYKPGLGIGRYIEQLLKHLELYDTENEYVIFLRKENWDSYQPANRNFYKILADYPWYGWREQIFFPKLLTRERLDLVHFPHFNVPIFYHGPYVVTIHDSIMQKMPISSRRAATTLHPLLYTLKYTLYSLVLKNAARRARAIITVSHASEDDLVTYLHIAKKKIFVIPNGVTTLPLPAHQVPSLPKPFFLVVGSAYPHKNLDFLLTVWKKISKQYVQYHLVLCGQEDYFSALLRAKISQEGLEARIHHIGTVSEQELAWLYQNTVALICPSLEEGFGLPAIEALSFGTLVIASRIPVFQEILGNAALFFDPRDPGELIGNIEKIVTDKSVRVKFQSIGPKQIQRYTWNVVAKSTLAVYHHCLRPYNEILCPNFISSSHHLRLKKFSK